MGSRTEIMIPFKTSRNYKKKCCACDKIIITGQGYIQSSYIYRYFVDDKKAKERISRVIGLFRKDNGSYENKHIQSKIRYKYYCDDCLYWLFENHLKNNYDKWLSKKVADKI